MSLLALMAAAAAGTVTIPAPVGDPDRWFGPNDIPKGAFDSGQSGVFVFKALVGANGNVDLCQAQGSSASEADREAFCERVKRRAKFSKVTGPGGAPTYYVVEDSFIYILPETWHRNTNAPQPNFVFDVQRLPGATGGKVDVPVYVAVDKDGKLVQCNVPVDAARVDLARAACGQLPVVWKPMIERNAADEAVAYVRQLWVEFRAPQA